MLLLPVAGQYEQLMNAQYVEKLALGVWSWQLTEAALTRFLQRIEEPMSQDERILWPDNERFFEVLQGTLNGLDRPISITV